MHDITVLTIVRDAEETLDKCLASAAWADDVFVVIDPRTADASRDIAHQHTEHVVEHEFLNPGNQRNWAIPQIETEWTLVLDSDEWLLPELIEKVQRIAATPDSLDGYDIKRRTYFFGKLIEHCGWHRDYNLRLFRTRKGMYNTKRNHEKIEIEGAVGRIHEPMMHDTYRSFDEYMIALDRFSTWGAEDMFEAGRRLRLSDIAVRPVTRFVKMYILRRGFLDGRHGLVLCGLASCSVFLKYAKLWNLERMRKQGLEVKLSRNDPS